MAIVKIFLFLRMRISSEFLEVTGHRDGIYPFTVFNYPRSRLFAVCYDPFSPVARASYQISRCSGRVKLTIGMTRPRQPTPLAAVFVASQATAKLQSASEIKEKHKGQLVGLQIC